MTRHAGPRALCPLLLLGAVVGDARASGTDTVTVPARSSGCTRSGVTKRVRPPSGDVASSVTINGVAHPYLLAVPARYEPGRPTPLVLLFHGFGGDGPSIADLTRMPAQGAARGFIVVTPDGPNRTWQLSGTGSDAAFIDGLVATVSNSWCVDVHRVYAARFSQGAPRSRSSTPARARIASR